jgi:hypothetical protein
MRRASRSGGVLSRDPQARILRVRQHNEVAHRIEDRIGQGVRCEPGDVVPGFATRLHCCTLTTADVRVSAWFIAVIMPSMLPVTIVTGTATTSSLVAVLCPPEQV